jgi:hypothetical protein
MTIKISEAQFVTGELLEVTGIERKTFNNWMQRGIIEAGQQDRTGRWFFSVVDILKFRIMKELVSFTEMNPARAAQLAERLADEAENLIEGGQPVAVFFLATSVSVEPNGWWLMPTDSLSQDMMKITPAVVIEMAPLVEDVIKKCTEILE